ncbi:hypothetical protein JCM6882_003458 [Rhodosporidiobolus microsporus]
MTQSEGLNGVTPADNASHDSTTPTSDAFCGKTVVVDELAEMSSTGGPTANLSADQPGLPEEVLTDIVSRLDGPSLAACRLVHSELNDIGSRFRNNDVDVVFHNVGAVWVHTPHEVKEYAEAAGTPEKAAAVRALDVRIYTMETEGEVDDAYPKWRNAYKVDANGWKDKFLRPFGRKHGIDLEARLRSMMKAHPNLHRLSFYQTYDFFDFSSILTDASLHLLGILSTPTFPPHLFPAFPNLHTLKTRLTAPKTPSDTLHPGPALRRLHLGPHITYPAADFDALFSALTSCSHQSLDSLTIPFKPSFRPSLLRLHNLQHLTLSNYTRGSDSRLPPAMPIDLLPLPPSLTSLTLGPIFEPCRKVPQRLPDPIRCSRPRPSPPPPPPPPSHLGDTFLASVSLPHLTRLLIAAPDFSALIYAELVALPAALPALETVSITAAGRRIWEWDRGKALGWGEDEVKGLRTACEARGVKLEVPEDGVPF